jgi:hypothetical protein
VLLQVADPSVVVLGKLEQIGCLAGPLGRPVCRPLYFVA